MASIANSAKTFEMKKAFPVVFYALMAAGFIVGIFNRPFDNTCDTCTKAPQRLGDDAVLRNSASRG